MSRSGRVVSIVLTAILLCGLAGAISARQAAATSDDNRELEQNVRLLTKVYWLIEQNYADPVDADRVIYQGAINGMVRTLDPHSNFVDPKSFQILREDRRGRYYGVGMLVTTRGGKVVVIEPFEGSPAHKAGLRPGDVIVRVDDKSTEGMDSSQVADLLKGPKGTQVSVGVRRDGQAEPVRVSLVRDEIPRRSVDYYEIRPGIGYVQIRTFSESTGREAAQALRQLNPSTLNGLILDLRGNPGGLVSEAVNVADLFLAKGQVIVSHRGRASSEKVFKATHGNGGFEYPLVVLIDRQSASAAEIVAGAIQDHDRGLVVGETSFGKGLVQNEYPLSENAGLLLTIARYYTPSGRLIQRNFTGISLYDYYFARQQEETTTVSPSPARQVRMTDSGRAVYGGGGISPDERVPRPQLSPFLQRLEGRHYAFFNFAASYLGGRSNVPRDFEPDQPVLEVFREFLATRKITYTPQEWTENLDQIKRRIKQEVIFSAYGRTQGDRIARDGDLQIMRAIELLPRAKQLAENARRVAGLRPSGDLN